MWSRLSLSIISPLKHSFSNWFRNVHVSWMGFPRSRARGKDSDVRKTGRALRTNMQGTEKSKKEKRKEPSRELVSGKAHIWPDFVYGS